ncbi:MAG TPA: AMP-binding protein, partial [Methylomirabilota bacterium]|nr:AMP-binding protein [Methylomirabilota bacterium]
METLSELLERRARDDAAKPFCFFAGSTVSFGDLAQRVRRLASGFAALGVRPGDRVAVMLANHPDHPMVFLALAEVGATQIPVNIHLRGLGLEYVLAHSEARAVVADERFAPELRQVLAKTSVELLVWRGTAVASGPARSTTLDDLVAAGTPQSTPSATDPDRVVSITYTSGTTGPPKGVMLGEKPYLLAGHVAGQLADVRAGDVMLTWEPLYHIGGSQVIVTCLQHGVPMALLERFSASSFWDQARRYRATQMHYLGGVLGILLKQPPRPDDREHTVRVAWGGGAPAHLWEAFEQRFGVRIHECYGMTEAASFTTINLERRLGSIGRPVPHFEVKTEAGEILVREREPGLFMRGYLKDPERTADALRDGWLHTGDFGTRDADGFFYFAGRRRDRLRRRGENVSAWEIEQVLGMHADVEACAAIGVPSDVGDEDIKVFVKPVAGKRLDPMDLVRWCESHLAYFQIPRYFELIDEFPLTPTERIRKDQLSPSVAGCFDRI